MQELFDNHPENTIQEKHMFFIYKKSSMFYDQKRENVIQTLESDKDK